MGRKKAIIIFLISTGVLELAFSNCARVSFDPVAQTAESESSSIPTKPVVPVQPPMGGTQDSLAYLKPTLAVRGVNCLLCHANIQSSLVTDFGYGTSNFIPKPLYSAGKPTFFSMQQAYGNHKNTDPNGAWQSAQISKGSVYIPKVRISRADAMTMLGVNQEMSLKDMMNLTYLNGSPKSMADSITPLAGQEPVIELSKVKIQSPSSAEILAMVPAGQNSQVTYVGAAQTAGAVADSSISGLKSVPNAAGSSSWALAGNPETSYIRNSNDTVVCKGDVVIKGTLLLKNVKLQTDAAGCRLYVSESVFIQGPITYVNIPSGVTPNLQISSARAILMGIGLARMGVSPSAAFNGGRIRVQHAADLTQNKIGGPWARFSVESESLYDPGATDLNARKLFFDNMALDAMKIGDELLDAGDAAAVAKPLVGASIVNTSEGPRLSINFKNLLLNAPHVHSRYDGSLTGVVISDIAMFLLSPSSVDAHFIYDSAFDGVPILPALTTQIFEAAY